MTIFQEKIKEIIDKWIKSPELLTKEDKRLITYFTIAFEHKCPFGHTDCINSAENVKTNYPEVLERIGYDELISQCAAFFDAFADNGSKKCPIYHTENETEN